MSRAVILFVVAALPACEYVEGLGDDTGATLDSGATGSDEPPTRSDPSGTGPSTTPEPAGWTVRGHTCPGDGIDAMWWDADGQRVWIGCGSNTSGYGLHHSPDRGETWPAFDTEPRAAVGGRVNAISRSSDGLLYVAGDQLLGAQVVALDTTTAPYAATVVYDAGPTIDEVQLAGSFARNDDGMAVVESSTGTAIGVRWAEGAPWHDAAGWASGVSYQMQHLVVHANQFYGTGSTMNEAPMVFLPPQDGHDEASGFVMSVVTLSPYAQELRSLDVDAQGRLVVGGVDHGADSGVIYVGNGMLRNVADWTEVWVADLLGSEPTWIDGVCRTGDVVAAVGRYSRTDEPIALLSTDAGVTWSDLTTSLAASAPLYRCAFLDGGATLAVGGGGGFLGFYAR